MVISKLERQIICSSVDKLYVYLFHSCHEWASKAIWNTEWYSTKVETHTFSRNIIYGTGTGLQQEKAEVNLEVMEMVVLVWLGLDVNFKIKILFFSSFVSVSGTFPYNLSSIWCVFAIIEFTFELVVQFN